MCNCNMFCDSSKNWIPFVLKRALYLKTFFPYRLLHSRFTMLCCYTNRITLKQKMNQHFLNISLFDFNVMATKQKQKWNNNKYQEEKISLFRFSFLCWIYYKNHTKKEERINFFSRFKHFRRTEHKLLIGIVVFDFLSNRISNEFDTL